MTQEYIWTLQDLKKVPKNGYRVFSTFSCGGGSSMGYKLAGFDVVGNVEIDPKINAMYVANHHPKYNFLMGVQDFYKPQNLANIPDELYDIDVLDGSPPCSTFSISGDREDSWGKEKKFREGQAKQVLSDLFFEFIKVAELLHPKVIIAENVKGLVTGNAKGYVNLIRKKLNDIGYDTQIFLLNSATMGVPQKRERVFFVCRRKDLHLPKIELSFNEKPIRYGEFADTSYVSLNSGTRVLEMWRKRKSTDRKLEDTIFRVTGQKNKSFNTKYVKKEEVCNTITAAGIYLRYDVPGTLSNKDIITISTFPQDYNFLNNNVQYVCGMSVPPFMMRGVAAAVRDQLLSKLPK